MGRICVAAGAVAFWTGFDEGGVAVVAAASGVIPLAAADRAPARAGFDVARLKEAAAAAAAAAVFAADALWAEVV